MAVCESQTAMNRDVMILKMLKSMDKKLDLILNKETKVDQDLQAIIDQAQANTDAEAAATKALNDMFAQLLAALKGTGPISAADRTALQAKVQAMKDSAAAVAAAIVADTLPPTPA